MMPVAPSVSFFLPRSVTWFLLFFSAPWRVDTPSSTAKDFQLTRQVLINSPHSEDVFPQVETAQYVLSKLNADISTTIVAKASWQIPKVVQAIEAIKAMDPYFHDSYNFVFNYLPHFKIKLIEDRRWQGLTMTDHAMLKALQILVLPEQVLTDSYRLMKKLRHEMRHMMMSAVGRTLAPDFNPSHRHCSLALESFEQTKALVAKVKTGEQRSIALLAHMLAADKASKLQQGLQELRQRLEAQPYSKKYYQNLYKTRDSFLLQPLKPDIKVGDTVWIKNREVQIQDLQRSRQTSNLTAIQFTYSDFLLEMVLMAVDVPVQVKKTAAEADYLCEMDAALHEYLPLELIKFLYPEFLLHTMNALQTAKTHPVPQKPTNDRPFYAPLVSKVGFYKRQPQAAADEVVTEQTSHPSVYAAMV